MATSQDKMQEQNQTTGKKFEEVVFLFSSLIITNMNTSSMNRSSDFPNTNSSNYSPSHSPSNFQSYFSHGECKVGSDEMTDEDCSSEHPDAELVRRYHPHILR